MSSAERIRARLDVPGESPVVVRKIADGDQKMLAGFNDGLSDQSRRLFIPHAYDRKTLDAVVERAESGRDRVYLGIADEKAIGYFFLWHFERDVPILGIGIVDGYQGMGLGKEFIRILVDDARENGNIGIDLTTLPCNERAFALYEKMGFRYIGDVDNVSGNGEVYTERRMFLPLEEGATPPARDFESPL